MHDKTVKKNEKKGRLLNVALHGKIIKVRNTLIWLRYTGYYENHDNDITGYMSGHLE